jgi:hypothetical protein
MGLDMPMRSDDDFKEERIEAATVRFPPVSTSRYVVAESRRLHFVIKADRSRNRGLSGFLAVMFH